MSFRYWNAEKWCYQRFKKHLSRKIPAEKRREALAEMLRFWTLELKNEYNPFAELKEVAQATELHKTAIILQQVCDERTAVLREKSRSTYQSKVTIFIEWLEKEKLQNSLIVDFSLEQAEKYLQYLTVERKLSATSRNAHLLTLRTLFSTVQARSILKENIWTKIGKLKEMRLGKLPFKSYMKAQLKNYLQANDPEMWLFVQFEYYCFIRPGELRRLTIGAIDLDDDKILIDGKISKNKKSEYVVIPPALKKVTIFFQKCVFLCRNAKKAPPFLGAGFSAHSLSNKRSGFQNCTVLNFFARELYL